MKTDILDSVRWLLVGLVGLAAWSMAPAAWALAPPDHEAYVGRPFGVARITLPPQFEASAAIETNNLAITDTEGRVFYPAFTTGKLRKLLGELLGGDGGEGPAALTVCFLFRGDRPLRVTVWTPEPVEMDIVPRAANARNQQRLLERWWRDYHAIAQQQLTDGDYSPVVQTYLTAMLGRRLRLAPPPARVLGKNLVTAGSVKPPEEVQESFELLLGLERLRLTTIRDSLSDTRGPNAVGVADRPLPPDIAWGPEPDVPFDPKVEIEPIARRVPEECFYVRYGKFSNYLWMYKLMREYGGGIGNMVTLRGVRGPGDQRVQQQLALPPPNSPLVEMLAETVIADVALIGRDLYVEDGASIGVVFQARTGLFGTNLNQQRQQTLAKEKANGATLETVSIGGRDVSLLSTPDNRLRSFYVVDGDFHLVTTSRWIVERFLEVGRGQRAMSESAEFKHARTQFPVARQDTIFAFFPSAFFRGLLSPQYQVEVGRRLRSLTDMQMLLLASLAAQSEGIASDELDALLAVPGLLPADFARRPDGSQCTYKDGRWTDSLRGGRGTFTPVTDVTLRGVTRDEAAACARRAAYYEQQFKQFDPLTIAVKRTAAEAGRERLTIEGRVSPLDESKYGRLLSVLGPPTTERIRGAAEDIITVQAHLKGGLLSPSVPPHQMFLGVQDQVPLADLRSGGFLQTLRILQSTPGYLGAWPKPGFLDWLPLGLGGGPPDMAGYSRLLLGLWRRQWEGFSVLAFDRNILDQVAPQLRFEEAEEAAQIRIHVGDVSQAKFAAWVNALTYQRARQASLGNIRLLHLLHQQLQVPRDQALDIAQSLLDAELVCTLGGQYELVERPRSLPEWQSTKLTPGAAALPEDYQSPLLAWFRGLDSSLIKQPDHLLVHATVDMQRQPGDEKPAEPSSLFNLFGPKPKPGKPESNPAAKPSNDPKTRPPREEIPPPKPAVKKRDF